jgi:dienelactone hydrolase
MKRLLLLALLPILSMNVWSAVVTREISYKIDTITFVGFLAYDDAVTTKRPGVLVVHEWWGLNDFTKGKTRDLAALGYVAFAADMYGNGQSTADMKIAGTLAGGVRGTPRMRQRVVAAFSELLKQPFVDASRTAAIGFCFGGSAVLELAYSGATVKDIVTFHGGLFPAQAQDITNIKAKILVLHGADDPTLKPEAIALFQDTMRKSKADWQMVYFGNSVHAFTNPSNGTDNSKGMAYNALSAARAWKYMKDFFAETM